MTCSSCGGQTASDVTGAFYCVICGMQVHPSIVREWRSNGLLRKPVTDALLAEELS